MIIDLSNAKIGDLIPVSGEEILSDELLDREGRFTAPVKVSVDVVLISESVAAVTGEIEYGIHTYCDKCGEECEYVYKAKLGASFSGSGEEDTYPFGGMEIDLSKAIQDCVILDLPTKVLCKEDCAGLCPICGTNLNVKQCKCKESAEDESNPFAALRQLDFSGGAE